jgi:hypothetical protein
MIFLKNKKHFTILILRLKSLVLSLQNIWNSWKILQIKTQQNKSKIFIDGDVITGDTLSLLDNNYLDKDITFVRMFNQTERDPRLIRDRNFNVVRLRNFNKSKETTDKYIAMAVMKAICNGITNITVVSQDSDFLDIFELINLQIEVECKFTLVLPPKNKEYKKIKYKLPKLSKNIHVIGVTNA